MVSKLGMAVQNCESLFWKFLYGRYFARTAAAQGNQRKIYLKKFHPSVWQDA
jgi:hypothetical protein